MFIDKVYFYYFLIHIPITVLMDATFVIPKEYQISIQRTLSNFHIENNKDFLAIESPIWMKIFVAWELVFQLPFFFYVIYDYLVLNKFKKFSTNVWVSFLIYGFNAGFTSMICLIYIFLQSESNGLSFTEMLNLLSLYLPTTLLPYYMMYDFGVRISNIINTNNSKNKNKQS